MAKIILKSFEEFIVTEEKAKILQEMLDEKKSTSENLQLSPVVIIHSDGTWAGTLANISSVSMSDKVKVFKHNFKSEEDITRFHNEYGYGAFKDIYLESYGVVDVETQFLLKTGLAKIDGNKLVRIAKSEKWEDLWGVYKNKII